jgi:UDP-N-acetylmuramoyl-L-alanyl-D-glutamate--2,6-diaminopimelate ligase
MYESGQKACVLEVSSHALALGRVNGLQFDGAAFTNLSRDHMDFHKDDEDYFQTKAQLFQLLKSNGIAAVNIDDPYGQRLSKGENYTSFSFGFSDQAMVQLVDWTMDINGMKLNIRTESDKLEINTTLISRFNVENILAATTCALALGIPIEKIKSGIEKVKRIPGRLEVYHIKSGVVAVIDYAHTPDALRKAQEAVRAITEKRLIVIFGAGGDRDRGKRPQMGQAVDELADVAIVTSDNPRTEDPQQIINDVQKGMMGKTDQITIVDRRQAIYEAVKIAGKGDIILIAGKGHETYQDVNGVRSDFDDALVVQDAVKNV